MAERDAAHRSSADARRPSLLARLVARVLPRAPDFYALLDAQCTVVVCGADALVAFMKSGDPADAERVRACEHEGDRLKRENLDVLYRSFATPLDREDIFQAIVSIDDVLNYAKATVTEMEVLHVPPDEHTRAMAELMVSGARSLAAGFAKLRDRAAEAEADAEAAHKSERNTERIYRQAIAELFDAEHYLSTLTVPQRETAAEMKVLLASRGDVEGVQTAVGFVVEILKRREVYRHMSNAADRVAHAGDVLRDIVAKVA